MPFNALVFTLCSKVELNWTRAIRPVIARSLQFSKIAKKLNIDLCQFFCHRKEGLSFLKSWNKKWGSPYSFLHKNCRNCAPNAFSPSFERGLVRVSKWHACEREKKVGAIHSTKISGIFGPKLNGSVWSDRKSFENTGPPFEVDHFSWSDRLEFWLNGSRPVLKNPFLQNLHRDSSFRTQCDKEIVHMKIKESKHKFNIHYRGSPWGSWTQQHAHCLRYAHSQHIESHFGKKQPLAKIAIAFLFSQLHFNNVTSKYALFYRGHLVMRSKKCAVQNQWITLN